MKTRNGTRPLRLPAWKGPRLTRWQRTARNLLLSVLAAVALYAALGFPPYTAGAMVDRMRRQYLLPNLEPVYVLRDSRRYDSDLLPGRHLTYIIARSGTDYLSFQYDTYLWNSDLRAWDTEFSENAFCAARRGMLYAASPAMAQASSAAAVVETKHETFTLEGRRLGGEVFGFAYETDSGANLKTAVDAAYRTEVQYTPNAYSYTIEDADLPVTVTLYAADGRVIDALHLTVSAQDITRWF